MNFFHAGLGSDEAGGDDDGGFAVPGEGVDDMQDEEQIAAMPELGTVNRHQVAALAGLAPFNRDSATLRGKRAIYGGRHAVRQALYMAALVAAKHHEMLGEAYRQMVARGKAKKVALVAIMRRLLIQLSSILGRVLREENSRPNLTLWKDICCPPG